MMSRTCVYRSTCRAGPDAVCQLCRRQFCALPGTPSTTYVESGQINDCDPGLWPCSAASAARSSPLLSVCFSWVGVCHVPRVPKKDSIATHPPNYGVQLGRPIWVDDLPVLLCIPANYVLKILTQGCLMYMLSGLLAC